ncbi:uncharacterized protein EV422DRAFT_546073 [Fimicolochytrium jonesii]|uniref:uncharacterized protein n=1 Tax=Fimicolochytrium jonesii TaxID=1396493 RepID=UPI0022FDF79F|nr:uncharacterized protein EV422DRAFT_546073 [Fimicolochytrium jonesii]KAI8816273.1 hypothetical protein EV422DRAFT_546073 [Fimicolochytrium jonesii]
MYMYSSDGSLLMLQVMIVTSRFVTIYTLCTVQAQMRPFKSPHPSNQNPSHRKTAQGGQPQQMRRRSHRSRYLIRRPDRDSRVGRRRSGSRRRLHEHDPFPAGTCAWTSVLCLALGIVEPGICFIYRPCAVLKKSQSRIRCAHATSSTDSGGGDGELDLGTAICSGRQRGAIDDFPGVFRELFEPGWEDCYRWRAGGDGHSISDRRANVDLKAVGVRHILFPVWCEGDSGVQGCIDADAIVVVGEEPSPSVVSACRVGSLVVCAYGVVSLVVWDSRGVITTVTTVLAHEERSFGSWLLARRQAGFAGWNGNGRCDGGDQKYQEGCGGDDHFLIWVR